MPPLSQSTLLLNVKQAFSETDGKSTSWCRRMKNDIGSFSSVLMLPHASVDSEKFFSLLIARIEGRPQLFLCICPAWVKNGSRETGF
jgi:hypothetical protein